MLHTVYDFGNENIHLDFLLLFVLTIVGIIGLISFRNLKTDFKARSFISKKNGTIVSVALILFAGPISIWLASYTFSTYYHTKIIYDKNLFFVTEGNVKNFKPSLYGKRDMEGFTVDGVYFECIYADKSNYGYNIPTSRGGVIKPDVFVRIEYFNDGQQNIILKLQTKGMNK